MWDVFAVSTYFTVSVLFWYLGLVPDLATMRDRAKGRVAKNVYWLLSFGWRGGNRQTFLGNNLHRVFHGNLGNAACLIDPARLFIGLNIFLQFLT